MITKVLQPFRQFSIRRLLTGLVCFVFSVYLSYLMFVMNSVKYILENRPVPFEEKVEIKKLGRPTPDLQIKSTVVCKTREFNRYFKRETTYL